MLEKSAVVKVSAEVEDTVAPDLAVFALRFGRKCKSQQECSEDFAAEKDRVARALAPFGIADDLLFSRYSSYACTSGRRSAITRYEYYCSATLKVAREEHDVPAVWAALSSSVSTARINLCFELEDAEAEEDRLVGKAFAKAKRSAEALAAASGMALGGVKEIRYRRNIDGFAYADFCAAPASDEGAAPDLQPEPIEVECSVDVDWWLKPTS